jgi:hypothetical protein
MDASEEPKGLWTKEIIRRNIVGRQTVGAPEKLPIRPIRSNHAYRIAKILQMANRIYAMLPSACSCECDRWAGSESGALLRCCICSRHAEVVSGHIPWW